MSDLFSFNGAEGAGWSQPEPMLGDDAARSTIPEGLARSRLPEWPRASEPELVRHYTWLSNRNFGIDTGFYPLGSCTMKHNPRLNERIVQLPGIDRVHPLQPEHQIQGLLAIFYEMQEMLATCSGMDVVTLQPVAGAQGEFAAIRCIQEFHHANGEGHRDKVIVPDSAHGTNPASASMCGYEIIEIPSADDGRLDLDALRAVVGEDTAAMMITNPSTLGLFETEILGATRIVHDSGGQMYYDGANFNAIIGKTDPGRMGFDAVHYNLHKTFSQPHGGGGPGSGPIGVKEHLARFLPSPIASRRERSEGGPEGVGDGHWYYWGDVGESSIGKVQQWHGNAGAVVRAWAFYRRYGHDLERMSEHAVLNSNYLRHVIMNPDPKTAKAIHAMPVEGAPADLVMHEFTLSLSPLKELNGVTGRDVAKRLLDYGYMSPTLYFPQIVPECLMIEPTETESKEVMDRFAADFHEILSEDPEIVTTAPHTTTVRRVDEVWAARNLVLRHPGRQTDSY
ncbi:MAG: aminomethyl-transferring glycine dehydrogenase subunit GcvPB [Candidatus Thalassarchaeaceae archaeon]|nr:aminomethyl-transferring glycine dehydrogenase subunit GcvPB [Candidatus Thalassarchaeaceae archaeon]MDP6703600.1 aminomethyl-transferring glycine dehydrogenase subunit GcvPB [Candidatus Thalassarchaeaceae archaeon]